MYNPFLTHFQSGNLCKAVYFGVYRAAAFIYFTFCIAYFTFPLNLILKREYFALHVFFLYRFTFIGQMFLLLKDKILFQHMSIAKSQQYIDKIHVCLNN